MSGTNYSKGGFRRITRLVPPVKMRLVSFAAVVACGSLLIAWITHSLWNQLDELQNDYAAVKGETFYLGVHLRGALRGLNNDLLQFGSSHDPTFRDAFLNDSAELKDWIATNRLVLAETAKLQLLKGSNISKQTEMLKEVENLYGSYLTNASVVLANTNGAITSRSFEETYKHVRDFSSGLFPLSDDLVASQREEFGDFLRRTQDTLANHEQLLIICSTMILGLTMILAIMVYRGMIAPLRFGLSQSEVIIERQEKLASLGVLASGVAHEIRNPLTAIKFRLFSLRKAVPSMANNEDAAIIGDEINRLDGIVQDFLQFARPSEPKLFKTQLSKILNDTRELLKPQLEKTGIELNVESSQAVAVYVDASQIKQVLINLIQNAAESIERNGAVTLGIRTGAAEFDGRTRQAVILSVTDTGKGISPEVEARLFDPFFTTKESGAGLGLAISARIVEKHGGLLQYETEVNQGTRFEIVLPWVENDAGEHTTH
jgi:signal transduction histidine kinase